MPGVTIYRFISICIQDYIIQINKENVKWVRGYEPFRPTFEAAKRNLALTPDLGRIIEPCNYGISDREVELECDYSYENTAGVGIAGILGRKGHVSKEDVKIKPAADEVARAINDFPNHSLVLKVDCEGSEFEIIESLSEQKLLDQIDVILLEWHEKSPQVIIDTLLGSGFVILNQDNLNGHVGMLYAVKQKKSQMPK